LWKTFLDPELEQGHFLASMQAEFVEGFLSALSMQSADLEQLEPEIVLDLSH
jgi:hypothetical protein